MVHQKGSNLPREDNASLRNKCLRYIRDGGINDYYVNTIKDYDRTVWREDIGEMHTSWEFLLGSDIKIATHLVYQGISSELPVGYTSFNNVLIVMMDKNKYPTEESLTEEVGTMLAEDGHPVIKSAIEYLSKEYFIIPKG